MFLYKYSGIVKQFNLVVHSHWSGYTYAVSEAKARSNLAYQFKKQFGLAPNAKVTLPGKIEMEVRSEPTGQISIAEYLKSLNKDTSELIAQLR